MFSIENSAFAWLALNLCIFFCYSLQFVGRKSCGICHFARAMSARHDHIGRCIFAFASVFDWCPTEAICGPARQRKFHRQPRRNQVFSRITHSSIISCLIEFYLVIRGEHNTHRSLATAAAAEWTKNCVIRARTTHTTPAVSCTLTIRKAIFILYSILATAFCIFCFSSHRTSCTYFVVVVVSFLHFAHTRTRLLCIWKYAIPNTYYIETYTFTMQWQRACACDRTQLNLGHCLRRCRRRLTSSSALRLLYCWNALFNITAMHILYVFHTVLCGMSQYSVWVYETCSSWHTNRGHNSIFQTTNKIYIYCRRKNGIFGGL